MARLFRPVLWQSDPQWEAVINIEDETWPNAHIQTAGVAAAVAAAASRWSRNALWTLMLAARGLCRKLLCRCWWCCRYTLWWCCCDQCNMDHGWADY